MEIAVSNPQVLVSGSFSTKLQRKNKSLTLLSFIHSLKLIDVLFEKLLDSLHFDAYDLLYLENTTVFMVAISCYFIIFAYHTPEACS